MLKGHVFKEQKFGNQIFALFINTFLNGKNGIHNDYKNSMQVTYSGSNLTVSSGVVCIQGRFLEEETSTTINAGTDALYCKLVVEIDLSKINTVNDFNQACYKLVTDVNSYPALTQNNIVKNNTGVYQYELARFRTTSSGIVEFQDMRTYLDFDSIYEEIHQHIQNIDDESIFVLKSDMEYSTSEKVIGTWIDGKPLYRKVITYTLKEYHNTGTMAIVHSIQNLKAIINLSVFSSTSDGAGYLFPNTTNQGGSTSPSSYDGQKIFFEIYNDFWSEGRVITMIIEYTKTTD